MNASANPLTEPAAPSMPAAATVDTTATPIDPPTSWNVLTTPEAGPASSCATMHGLPRHGPRLGVAVRGNADVIALRNLVAAELHRFPELAGAWRHHGPAGHHPAVADALRSLAERGRLDIPDLETAIIQLYALLVFPHMVFSSYGTALDDATTDRLITSGVDMFLGHYALGGRRLAGGDLR